MKIGVTPPGSSTHFMAAYMMAQAGLKADDASFIGTGADLDRGRRGAPRRDRRHRQLDPMITMMESEKLVKVVADTRTAEGTQAGLWRRRIRAA